MVKMFSGFLLILGVIQYVSTEVCEDADTAGCITRIQTEAKALNFTFLPDNMDLNTYLNITFDASKVDFRYCCEDYSIPGAKFNINPLKPTVKAALTKDPPSISAHLAPNVNQSAADSYTLLVVDPYVPFNSFLHMLAVNVPRTQVLNVSKGSDNVIFEYIGPTPVQQTSPPQKYFFLLYEQAGSLDKLAVKSAFDFGDLCNGRCSFNASKFVSNHSLTLIGLSWMETSASPFTLSIWIKRGQFIKEADVCKGVEGYADPCPTPRPTTTTKTNGAETFCGHLIVVTIIHAFINLFH